MYRFRTGCISVSILQFLVDQSDENSDYRTSLIEIGLYWIRLQLIGFSAWQTVELSFLQSARGHPDSVYRIKR
jgi:hypothetical protein